MKLPLRDFQEVGASFAMARGYSLNGDQMGLGKSAQALKMASTCAVRGYKKKTLVLCPAFLVLNWRAEIEKFLGVEHLKSFDVGSYDSICKVPDFKPYSVVIADECHYLKSLNAKRTKAFHERMEAHPPAYFLGLSGTPIKNHVGEVYSLLKLCWLGGRYPEFDRYSQSFWLFQKEFMHEKRMKFGGRKFSKFEGVKNAEALRDLIKPVYIRRKTKDVISLPPQVRQEVVVAEKAETDAALQAAWDAYQGGKDQKNFSSGKAVAALATVPFTVELAREVLTEAGQVIIFTDHVQSARALYKEFPKGQCVTGETPMAVRNTIVGLLNSGKLEVLIATIGSLSVGINLTGCNYTIFNDTGFVPADIDQAEGRTHRIGQEKTTFYYYVLASRIAQRIYRAVRAKREVIAEVGT